MKTTQLIYQVMQLIDQQINRQINQILHHSIWQTLEANWRSLYYLCDYHASCKSCHTKLKLLDLSIDELHKDLLHNPQIEQSVLFEKLYNNVFDQAGGEPFGLLISDHAYNLPLLEQMAKIAAAIFCPTLISIDTDTQNNTEQFYWQTLRNHQHNQFIGIMLTKIILRANYPSSNGYLDNAFFKEVINQSSDYLWGNSAYLLAMQCICSIKQTGWFDHLLTPPCLQKLNFLPNQLSICDQLISDPQQINLSDKGFIIPFIDHYTQSLLFCQAKTFYQQEHIRVDLPQILSISRFAQTLKIILRDNIGSYQSPSECQQALQQWLLQYCASNTQKNSIDYTKYPLVSAGISVNQQADDPQHYLCKLQLTPRSQTEQVTIRLKFISSKAR